MISFGTDGWRAISGKEFNYENVKRVTLAIGRYIAGNFGFEKKILIGYDPRKSADEYSLYCAELLKEKGFDIYYSSRVVPTPVLAYSALINNACAIMFTASHNPPEYLGMKFIPDYAGPAETEITDEILANLDLKFDGSGISGPISKIDFAPEYYKHLENIIDFEAIKKYRKNIIYDGLYSASIGYFDEFLKRHEINFESIHTNYDVEFGGGMPDPKPEFLGELIERVKKTPDSAGVATDGDADRFGVINENGRYVSPNEIIAILLKHLLNRGYSGSVVKTVGSSLLIDCAAKKLGVNVIETAVGFKHVGEAMRKNRVIIGGEESGGLSIAGHIPEKDGLLANLLILEAIAYSKKSLIELQKDLYELTGCRFYNERVDLRLNSSTDINAILSKVKNFTSIGGYRITSVDTKDGIKLMLGNSTKILVRQSGTEPLLRIYYETDSVGKLEDLRQFHFV